MIFTNDLEIIAGTKSGARSTELTFSNTMETYDPHDFKEPSEDDPTNKR
jgi:hypothetical protein